MEKDNPFIKNKVIGNNAESIIEFLINSMPNWKCIKFGVENHIMDLKQVVRKRINSITKKIKSMPDFVVFNEKTGETFFLEVKYRGFVNKKDGKSEYKLDFLNEYKDYWGGTKLLVVHGYEPYFFVIDLDEIKPNMCRKEQVGKNDWNYYWNFAGIEKSLKDIFPELSDDIIQAAIKFIPKNNND